MIQGRSDTWFTIEEFAAMIGREPKTLLNWTSEGKIMFADLCGVRLVALSMIESMIAGHVRPSDDAGELALRMIGRLDRHGRRVEPERHRRRPKGGQGKT